VTANDLEKSFSLDSRGNSYTNFFRCN